MKYISHPKIVPDTVEEREYQIKMADGCLKRNTLIILPTGLGKTVVALIVTANTLQRKKKVLIMAPTKPLVEQHYNTFSSWLRDVKIGVMNGFMAPNKRADIVKDNDLIISTPQVIGNDLEKKRYSLSDFGLIIYDEAHRAVGDYAYVKIASKYDDGITLGMTASPGSNVNKMLEVCNNLGIEYADMRTESDPDVSPYVHDIFVQRIEVNVPEDLLKIIGLLNEMLDTFVAELTSMGIMDPSWPASMKHLLTIGNTLQKRAARGEKNAIVFRGLVLNSAAIKAMHAVTLAETQGVSSVKNYISKIEEEANKSKTTKASREIVAHPKFKELTSLLNKTKVEHPKISRVMSMVSMKVNNDPNTKVIVFTQYRDTCDMLTEKLSSVDGVKAAMLIGQSKGGLKQKEQISLLEDFRSGKYNVLVSTSVGEEGLDITSTDMVIFYEPLPSEIRTIQRRGRTGRKNAGEVYVLIAKGTRDELYDKNSLVREEKMKDSLPKLNRMLDKKTHLSPEKQTRLSEY